MTAAEAAVLASAAYLCTVLLLLAWAFRHDHEITEAFAPLDNDDDVMAVADAVQDPPTDAEIETLDFTLWELEAEPVHWDWEKLARRKDEQR